MTWLQAAPMAKAWHLRLCACLWVLLALSRAAEGACRGNRQAARVQQYQQSQRRHRRSLLQSPPANLLSTLQGISVDFQPAFVPGSPGAAAPRQPLAPASESVQTRAAQAGIPQNLTAAIAAGTSPTADGGPGPCTDPILLASTMTTFCKLSSLDALASLSQDSVRGCCRLTSATLQKGCWDPCSPPQGVSADVVSVLKLWRTVCLINTSVSCDEQQAIPSSGK